MKLIPLAVACLSGSLVLGGCAAFTGSDTAGIQVATAFYPLEYVAQRVAGDLGTVQNLTAPGKEPHDLELTIRETAAVAGADLVVYESGFQPAVDAAVDQNSTGDVLDATDVVELEDYADGQVNPHFWQDPLRMAALGDAVAKHLADLDPDHADTYRTNAADLRSDLEDLDTAYADGLADCERTTIVVSHDAFGYLAKYGLDMAPIAGLSPDAEPTPADLAKLQDLIRSDGITTVFGERLVSPRLTQSLADDMGITAAVLDPLEGLTADDEDADYLSIMTDNLHALEKANGCS
ncbi:zinc ABC transporter substrate-binding protein [Nocardioides sp. KIGAM211]|uniref:Zinc ABC transporter substrate-binding protein n=1 Tax=Nocardioides luti TaxID=2761101 RepID=A0A7X0RJB4_9ACTN|nr:metal ABC transporter substrate-binding protein [Nocardioides luti]MBB6629386.1 zinc ABC transporter substrate-binding protein [Nocardioides luti]